jgi:protein-tyrosine phosphatase
MNRSATLATAYYIQKTGQPLLQAIQYMVALRPIILRNENFIKQLVVWAYDNGFASGIESNDGLI